MLARTGTWPGFACRVRRQYSGIVEKRSQEHNHVDHHQRQNGRKRCPTSRKLNSVAYWNALDSGKENPIELELDKLFPEATDKEYKCSPLPNISSEAASRRVDYLLENKTDNPLPILTEMKYYLDNDLISKEEYAAAAESLIGSENARKLVDGDIHEREEALQTGCLVNFLSSSAIPRIPLIEVEFADPTDPASSQNETGSFAYVPHSLSHLCR